MKYHRSIERIVIGSLKNMGRDSPEGHGGAGAGAGGCEEGRGIDCQPGGGPSSSSSSISLLPIQISLSLSLSLSLSVYSWELQPYWNNLTPNAPFWLNGWNSNFHLTELLFIPYLSLCLVAMTRRLKKKKRIREWIGETPVLGFKFLLGIHKIIEWNKMYLSKGKKWIEWN